MRDPNVLTRCIEDRGAEKRGEDGRMAGWLAGQLPMQCDAMRMRIRMGYVWDGIFACILHEFFFSFFPLDSPYKKQYFLSHKEPPPPPACIH